jgi:hypothetical protein
MKAYEVNETVRYQFSSHPIKLHGKYLEEKVAMLKADYLAIKRERKCRIFLGDQLHKSE